MTREQRREAAKQKRQRAIARKNAKQAAPGDMPSSEEESSVIQYYSLHDYINEA